MAGVGGAADALRCAAGLAFCSYTGIRGLQARERFEADEYGNYEHKPVVVTGACESVIYSVTTLHVAIVSLKDMNAMFKVDKIRFSTLVTYGP